MIKKTYLFILLIFFCNISCSNNMRNSFPIHAPVSLMFALMGVGVNQLYNKNLTLKANFITASIYALIPPILFKTIFYISGVDKISAQLQANEKKINSLESLIKNLQGQANTL